MAMTLEEIRRAGLEALAEKLGPVDMVRFLQQFETGRGDYSAEREAWLGSLDKGAFIAQVKGLRKTTNPTSGHPSWVPCH
jgi:hypothetical protein